MEHLLLQLSLVSHSVPSSFWHFLPFHKYVFAEMSQTPLTGSALVCGGSIVELAGTVSSTGQPWTSSHGGHPCSPHHPLPKPTPSITTAIKKMETAFCTWPSPCEVSIAHLRSSWSVKSYEKQLPLQEWHRECITVLLQKY